MLQISQAPKKTTTKAWNTPEQGNLQRIHRICEGTTLSLQVVLKPFVLPGSISSVAGHISQATSKIRHDVPQNARGIHSTLHFENGAGA